MILTLERKMEFMQALGDVSLYMEGPFDWRVRHRGVLILSGLESEESPLIPEGQDTNPYGCIEDHWRQITENYPLIRSQEKNGVFSWSTAMKDWVLIPTEHLQAA